MKNVLNIALLSLVAVVANNSYALEKYSAQDFAKEMKQSREAARQKAERERRERQEARERQQKTFEQATQEFYKTGRLR